MLEKIKKIYYFLCDVNLIKFVHYNYFSRCVVRDKHCYIYPHKGAVINLHRTARIYLHGKRLELGFNQYKHSKTETHLRMKENAVWNCKNGCMLFYDTVLEVHKNAVLDSNFFSMNGGSVIICAKHITIGEDAMLGRNIVIYDSDYHQVLDPAGKMKNFSKEVVVGAHVWLTNQIMVLKGVKIGDGALISPYTVVRKDVPAHSMIVNGALQKVISEDVSWSREFVNDIG